MNVLFYSTTAKEPSKGEPMQDSPNKEGAQKTKGALVVVTPKMTGTFDNTPKESIVQEGSKGQKDEKAKDPVAKEKNHSEEEVSVLTN